MPTHKLKPSDDEIVITAHKPAPRAAAPERPAKRRRTGSVERPMTFLDLLRVDQPRLIRALLAPVLPADLVSLCSAFQTVRKILQQASSDDIWKRSRENLPDPPPPPRPSSMDEMSWTTLLFVRKCQHCGKATTREIDWGLRRRFCIACQSEHVKGSRYPSTLSNVSQDVLSLVPCSGTAGASAKNYWAPEIASVHRELTRLDAMVERGDRDARELRRKFVQKREDYVEEVLNLMPAGAQWQKAYKDAQVAGAGVSKTDVRRRVVARFVALGYRADDVEAQLPATFSQGIIAGSEIAWTRFAKKIQPKLDERRHILSIKIALLQEHYRQFLGVYVPDDWETLVPFGDITSIPEVRSRLKDATDDQIVALGKTLTSFVGRWRTRVEQQLLDLLPGRPADAASLRLATSVFVRGDDPMPLTFPHMLLGSNIRSDALPYATKQGQWTIDGLRHDAVAVQVVKDYCRVSGLELADATVAMLDESPMRLQCARCDEEWPLVFHWRHAIEHAHRHHAEEDRSLLANLWRASSVANERQAQRLDEETEVWVCSLCPAASRVPRSTVDVRTHLRERHHATEIVKGQAYRRSLAALMQAPMSTLALHAAFEDCEDAEKAWNCRHCVHEGDQRSIIAHLKEEHAIDLQRKPISQRLQTMPPMRVPSTPRLRDAEAGFSQNPIPSSSRRPDQQAPPSSSSKRSRAASIAAVSEDDIPILALKRSRTASSTRASNIAEPPEPTKVVIALYESSSSDSEDDPTSSKVRIHGRSKTGTARAESLIPAKREASEYDVPPPNAKKRAVSSSNSSVKGKKPTETIDLTFSDPPLPQDTLPRTARDSPTTSRDGLDSIPTPSEDSSSMGESNSSEDETSSSEEDAMDVSCPVDLPQLPPLAAVPQHIRFETNPAPRAPAPPSTASQLPKPPGFVCKHCKGSEHRFKHAGIMQHLAVTHGIVSPKKKTDYEFRASMDPIVDTVYMCKVCHMSMRQFDWTALTAHMATRHRLVAPRAGQHYTEATPREKTPDPSLVKRQRYICRVCPAADKPRLLTMHGLKQHLFAVHGIEKMIYRQNFDKLKLSVGDTQDVPSGDVIRETFPSCVRQPVDSDRDSSDDDDDGSPAHADESNDSIVVYSPSDSTDAEDASSVGENDSDEGEDFEEGGKESEKESDCEPGLEESDARLTTSEATSQVVAYLNATGLGQFCDFAFTCNLCPNKGPYSKSRNLPGILAHLASSCHRIARPNVPNEYEPVARRTLHKFRYKCGLCRRHFSLEKIKRHLARQHSLEYEDAYKIYSRDTFSDPDAESAPGANGTCGVSGAVTVKDEPYNLVVAINPSRLPIAGDRPDTDRARMIASEAEMQILLCDELRGVSSTIACRFLCKRCESAHRKPHRYNLYGVVRHLMFAPTKKDHDVLQPKFRDDYDLVPGTKRSTMDRYKCALCVTKQRAYNKTDLKGHLSKVHSIEDVDLKTHAVDILKDYKTPRIKTED